MIGIGSVGSVVTDNAINAGGPALLQRISGNDIAAIAVSPCSVNGVVVLARLAILALSVSQIIDAFELVRSLREIIGATTVGNREGGCVPEGSALYPVVINLITAVIVVGKVFRMVETAYAAELTCAVLKVIRTDRLIGPDRGLF